MDTKDNCFLVNESYYDSINAIESSSNMLHMTFKCVLNPIPNLDTTNPFNIGPYVNGGTGLQLGPLDIFESFCGANTNYP